MSGLVFFQEEGLELTPPSAIEETRRAGRCAGPRRASCKPHARWCPDLRFPASRTGRNALLWFRSYPVCGTLLKPLKLTDGHSDLQGQAQIRVLRLPGSLAGM